MMTTNNKRRVVITGMGVVSPLGCSLENYWRNLTEGRSGVRRIARYNAETLPVSIAAEVSDFNLSNFTDAPAFFTLANGTRVELDRRAQYALAATEMALLDSGLKTRDGKLNSALSNASVYFGAGEGDNDVPMLARMLMPFCTVEEGCDERALLAAYNANATGSLSEFALHDQLMEGTCPASLVAARYGVEGEVTSCLTACAASAQAIGESVRRIQSGECDAAIAGGAHAMTAPLDVVGFALLSALTHSHKDNPEKASRPFDLKRDGFVLGEGSGVLILEECETAKRRGARIYAEVAGYGATSDAYRVTDMHPQARGAVGAIRLALEDASIAPDEIAYINAHGTSTVENDRQETKAIHAAFGDAARTVAISSTKSMTGHAVAAAGALEAIAIALALREQVAPPTINLETPDPECDLDYVPNRARRIEGARVALSNSFGFGGQNIALVLRK